MGVLEHISETDTDICFIQETFLKKNDSAKLAEIRDYGFDVISAPRHRCGGGIAAVYRQGLPISHNRKMDKFKTFEVMEITIQSDIHLLRFVNIYRAPYSKKHRYTILHFLEEFEQYLQTVTCKEGTPVIVGDFNIHVEKLDDTYSRKFGELLSEHGLVQKVPHTPTHDAGGTLDLILTDTRVDLDMSTPEVIQLGTNSDHFFVRSYITPFSPLQHSSTYKFLTYRKFDEVDVTSFRADLIDSGISNCSNSWNISDAVELLDTTLRNLIDKHCPVIKRKVRLKERGAIWFDQDLRDMRARRRALERLNRKHPNTVNRTNYIKIRRTFNKLVWVKKKAFFQKSLDSSRNNSKALYKKINKLIGANEVSLPKCTSDEKLAEKFKVFFTEKIEKIRSEIDEEKRTSDPPHINNNRLKENVSFKQFYPMLHEDITKLINNMPDKFCALDRIPTWLLKQCLPELSNIICFIVNSSLSSGVFPDTLKSAILMPTLKGNDLDRDILRSYRPVSNLSFLSKVLEKCALNQLSQYLNNNKLLCNAQSGYRAHHSCETLMARMFNDINSEILENNAVALVLLDLSAAFDTIDHEIMAKKLLEDYGIDDVVLMWIMSYLSNRSFSVKINNSSSSTGSLIFGVPQGSLLGPILFILYTKDLEAITNSFGLSIQLYADDSQLYISFNPLSDMDRHAKLDMIKQCLLEIKRWMAHNFMKLNEDKTQFLLLGKKTIVDRHSELSLELSPKMIIPLTDYKNDSAKSLGVKLDSTLSMKRQMNDVRRKCFWTLTNLGNFGHYLSEDLKISLVKTLVLSKLDYCNALYAGTQASVLNKLRSTMNSAIRFIFNIKDWSINLIPYYKKAHILPIQLRIKYKICLLVQKSLNGTAPPYLRQLIKLYCEEPSKHSLRSFSDHKLLLRPQTVESKWSRKLFSYNAPIMWNSLPENLRHIEETEIFKRKLKTILFGFIDSLDA